jgi:hypothetical protein
MMARHRFLSWLRLGLSAARSGDALAGANPVVDVKVQITGRSADLRVTMYGPGDVAGLLGHAIRRREPAPSAVGVSATAFPFVELTPADLPWRLSPGASGDGLLPWLVLVVVPADTPFGPRPGAPLPALTVSATELPDPTTLWAWAHVQVDAPASSADGASTAELARTRPELATARLIAPRRLERRARYRACIVPVFEAGRLAGLGEQVGPEVGMRPAWSTGDPQLELPVYDSWEFQTGDADDFETIARRLRGFDASSTAGVLAIDVRDALGTGDERSIRATGVLRPAGTTAEAIHPEIARALAGAIVTDQVDAVGLPLYGGTAAARSTPDPASVDGDWLAELNLDPRRRVLAAAGAAAVRADQDTLVAEVRRRLGQVDRANALVRGAQLAALTTARLGTRHLAARPATTAAMLWKRIPEGSRTAPAASRELLSPAMRRLARSGGPVARGRKTAPKPAWTRIGRDLDLTVARPQLRPGALATLGQVTAPPADPPTRPPVSPAERPPRVRVVRRVDSPRIVRRGVPIGQPTTRVEAERPRVPALRVLEDAAFREAVIAAEARRVDRLPPAVSGTAVVPADVDALAGAALETVAPIAMARRTAARVSVMNVDMVALAELTELRPAIDAPYAVVDRIATVAPERFLPDLGALPPDTVSVFEVDPAAVEAVMAGANHELARELAWRGISADPRATPLATAWRRLGGTGPDIQPIAGWSGHLGENGAADATVFVVRSELVRRFPGAVYTCVRAVTAPQVGRRPGDETLLPLFTGTCGADLAYAGFARPLAELRAGDGWYVTIQERPGSVRFGLDAEATGNTGTWANLSWADVEASPYLGLEPPRRPFPATPRWAASAAHMAAITERPAVRVAIHLDELLPG